MSAGVTMNKLKFLDKALKGKNFLVGNTVTLADVSMVTTTLNWFRFYCHYENKNLFQMLLEYSKA